MESGPGAEAVGSRCASAEEFLLLRTGGSCAPGSRNHVDKEAKLGGCSDWFCEDLSVLCRIHMQRVKDGIFRP